MKSFGKQKFFTLMKSNLFIFYLMADAFCALYNKSLPTQVLRDTLLCFLPEVL